MLGLKDKIKIEKEPFLLEAIKSSQRIGSKISYYYSYTLDKFSELGDKIFGDTLTSEDSKSSTLKINSLLEEYQRNNSKNRRY